MRVGRVVVTVFATVAVAMACDTDPQGISGGTFGVGGANSSAGRGSGGVGGVGGVGGGTGAAAGRGGGAAGSAGSVNTGGAGSPAGCSMVDAGTAEIPFTACAGQYCTLEESIAGHATLECSLENDSDRLVVTSGCGFILLRWSGGFSGGAQVFDAATHREVGYSTFNDVPEPPCNTYRHVAGQRFPADCVDYSVCSVCDALGMISKAPGAAGAAGEGGGAGAGGAGSCLDGLLD